MLAIEVEFLTGRYAASAHNDRQRHEWPPHPARLFSALVAEWGGADDPDPAERRVLELIEGFGAPMLRASEAASRSVVTHYVPVNDHTAGEGVADAKFVAVLSSNLTRYRDSSLSDSQRKVAQRWLTAHNSLPSSRERQPRFYPSVTPVDPVVTYAWPDAELAPADSDTLDGLLARVTRVGHSASLVACRLTGEPGPASHRPSSSGSLALRTVSAGQLGALEAEYGRHQGSRPRSLPASITRYAPVVEGAEDVVGVVVPDTAGEMIVFEIQSLDGARKRPGPRDVVALTTALRGALMHYAAEVPEVLSGHRADGSVTDLPHVAFLALPDVGYRHAHGDLLGVAVLLPSQIDSADRRAVLGAIGRWEAAFDDRPVLTVEGGRLRWWLSRQTEWPALVGLRASTWSTGATRWASATPVALPWRSGRARRGASEWDLADEWVAKACAHVGLPEPTHVGVALTPALLGGMPAGRYPAFRQGGIARRLVHVNVEFDAPVQGPLVLGSGRFRGLGLMRPVRDQELGDE